MSSLLNIPIVICDGAFTLGIVVQIRISPNLDYRVHAVLENLIRSGTLSIYGIYPKALPIATWIGHQKTCVPVSYVVFVPLTYIVADGSLERFDRGFRTVAVLFAR